MFYLFFPLLCIVLLRLRRGTLLFVALLLAFAAMGPFARTVWTTNAIWGVSTSRGGMDAMLRGGLCALGTERPRGRGASWGQKLAKRRIGGGSAGRALVVRRVTVG